MSSALECIAGEHVWFIKGAVIIDPTEVDEGTPCECGGVIA